MNFYFNIVKQIHSDNYKRPFRMTKSTLHKLFSSLTKFNLKTKTSNNIPQLGRWNYTYNEKTLDNKIRWANEDHCGVCYNQTTSKSTQSNDTDVFHYITECCGNNCPNCDIFKC
jgi:predicted transcriptional regulator